MLFRSVKVQPADSSDSFIPGLDWKYIAYGAAGLAGLALIILIIVLATRRRKPASAGGAYADDEEGFNEEYYGE